MHDSLPRPRYREHYWMDLAVLSALNSKDPNTQVGACLVSPDGRLFFTGWNGFPEGIEDDTETWHNRKNDSVEISKYDLVVHAERNALDNAHRAGVYPKGWHLYCTHLPCPRCAIDSIILPGITTVFYLQKHHMGEGKTKILLDKKHVHLVLMSDYPSAITKA
jgi:dCMP deaminase